MKTAETPREARSDAPLPLRASAVRLAPAERPWRDGLLAGLGVLLLVVSACLAVFWRWFETVVRERRVSLLRSASIAASLIDPEQHAGLVRSGGGAPTARAGLVEALRRLQGGDPRVAAACTVVLIGGEVQRVVDTLPTAPARGGPVPFPDAPPPLRAALAEGEAGCIDAPYPGRSGRCVSAWAPIGPGDGTGAMVCVELRFEPFQERLDGLLHTAALGMTVAVLLAALAGLATWRHRLQAVETRARLHASVAELGAAIDEAEAATAAKSTFLATMSHELRTPMNGVVGMLELMAGTPMNPQQCEYVETARRSAQGLLGVLNDILDLSKIEAGRLTIHAEEFDLETVVGEVADMLAELARKKGIELAYGVRPLPFPRVIGDGQRIRQVLVNLVGNAVRFTQRGFVGIRVAVVGDQGETVRVRIEVQDTGPGIAESELEKLFRPFSQLDGSHRRVHGGTGLGLAISRRLVELMQGTIGVDSRPGRGSTFWCEVPLQRTGKSPMGLPAPRTVTVVGPQCLGQQQLLADLKVLGWSARCVAEFGPAVAGVLAARDPRSLLLVDVRALGDDDAQLAGLLGSGGGLRGACQAVVLVGDGRRSRLSGLADPAVPVLWHLWPFPIVRFLRDLDARERSGSVGAGPSRAVGHEATLGLRVLVAEDNEVNQRVTLAMLRRLGCEAVVVPDGVLAVAQAERGSFDCILMDCMMPRMDGYQATQQIRERERAGARRLPILALTANAMVGDKERCIASGMDGVLTKPVVLQDLTSALWDVKRGKERDGADAPARA